MDGEAQSLRIIEWIQGARQKGKKRGLDNMRALLTYLGEPHTAFRSVHVAGTNGKGSTCAYLERALRENGYATGLFTSPYLCRYHERIRLNGEPIADADIVRLGGRLMEAYERLSRDEIYPTMFELSTALAFLYFAEKGVDIAVVEVGIGGRLDCTNVIQPSACAIASISLDHTKVLGDTIKQIAFEKAGIIKPGIPVALQQQAQPEADDVVAAVAREQDAPLIRVSDRAVLNVRENSDGARFTIDGMEYEIALPGHHQVANARLAIATLSALRDAGFLLDEQKTRRGIALAKWPGRLEWLAPNLLIDGAHNPEGASALRAYLEKYFSGVRKVLLTGMMRDKEFEACAETLAPVFDVVVATRIDWPKALEAEALRDAYVRHGARAEAVDGVQPALNRAKQIAGGDLVVVSGSLYLAGDVRNIEGGHRHVSD